MSEGSSGCLFSLGARSAAGCSGKASCGDASCGDIGVVVGEGEKSGCDGCGGVLAGDVGVGEMWFGVEGRGCGGGVIFSGSVAGGVDSGSLLSCIFCRSLSSFHRAWHCSTEYPTRRATKIPLGRSLGLPLSSTRRQSASPSQASQSACGLSGGGGGAGGGGGGFRLRAGGRLGGGEGEGVSSELMEGCGGGRTRGLGGAESQDEVGEGKLMEYVGAGGSWVNRRWKVGSAWPMWCKKRM